MKKYNFELQSLLNIKEQKEDLLMNQLSVQQEKVESLKNMIIQLQKKRINHIDNFENNLKENSKIYNITSFYSYLEKVDSNISDLESVLTKEKNKLKIILDDLKVASKEKKVLEKLKEKDLNSYKREVTLEEYKQNDEHNSYIHYSDNNEVR